MCQSHLYRHGPTGGWSSHRSNDLLPGPQWDVHRVQGSSPNEPTPRLAIYKVRYNREIKSIFLSSTVLLFYFFLFKLHVLSCVINIIMFLTGSDFFLVFSFLVSLFSVSDEGRGQKKAYKKMFGKIKSVDHYINQRQQVSL